MYVCFASAFVEMISLHDLWAAFDFHNISFVVVYIFPQYFPEVGDFHNFFMKLSFSIILKS